MHRVPRLLAAIPAGGSLRLAETLGECVLLPLTRRIVLGQPQGWSGPGAGIGRNLHPWFEHQVVDSHYSRRFQRVSKRLAPPGKIGKPAARH